jgi:hypothetical protein
VHPLDRLLDAALAVIRRLALPGLEAGAAARLPRAAVGREVGRTGRRLAP